MPPAPELPPDRAPDRALPWIAALLIALALIGRVVFLRQPINSDSAMFVYMGKLITTGGRIGVDLIDNKLPSVGLLMSAPYHLFGAAWPAYTVLGLAMSIAAMLVLARSAARGFGSAARWPVLIAAAVWLNFTPAVFGQFQLETIEVFFTAIAGAATLELLTTRDWRDAFLAGLAIGTAMWAKPTAGAILPAIALAVLLANGWRWPTRVKSLTAVAVGVIIPLAVCGWLLISTGMAATLPATLAQLRDYSNNSTADAIDLMKPIIVLGVVLLPVLVLGLVFRRDRIDRQDEPAPEKQTRRTIAAFVIVWLVMELLAVLSQRRMYAYHFLVLAPPASLLTGLWPGQPRVRSLLFAFTPPLAMSLAVAWPMMIHPPVNDRQERVIAWLADHSYSADSAWMDDDARLLTETDLRPGTRVPLIFLFANSDQTPARLSRQILDDFRTRQPRFIVLQADPNRVIDLYAHHMVEMVNYPQRAVAFGEAIHSIQTYVEQNYNAETNLDGLTIWRRSPDTPLTANADR